MDIGTEKRGRKAEIILLIIVVIWGINTPVMKIGLLTVTPLVYNACRLIVTAVLVSAALLLSKSYKPMPRQDLKQIAAISVFGFFFNQVLIVFGLSQTTAGNASLVMATLPVEVALINCLFRIEMISRQMTVGIVTGLLGVFLIVLGSNKELSLLGPHLLGALLLLVGQFCYGYYTIFFKQLINKYSIYQIFTYVITINAVLFSFIAMPELLRLDWRSISASAWFSIFFSSGFALGLANVVWLWIVGVLGSTKAALYQYLCPVVSIAVAWIYLDETFGFIQCIGAAVTFLGLYLTRNQMCQTPEPGNAASPECVEEKRL